LSSRLLQFFDRFTWRMPSFQQLSAAYESLLRERETLLSQRDALERERDELSEHARRLSDEAGAHRRRERAWAADRSELLRQRDTLERERDELSRHAALAAANLSESLEREQALRREVETLRSQRDALESERDQLKNHLERLRADYDRMTGLLGVPPGHFYSPIVNPEDPHVRRACARVAEGADETLEAIRCEEANILAWFQRLARHSGRFPFPERKEPSFRYWFDNPAFSGADAVMLFAMLCELRPRRVIEIGVGFSSCLIMDTNDRFLDASAELTFVDPHPETLDALLAGGDPYRRCIRRQPLQDVPTAPFAALTGGDILFLDSSHVLKTGSDVNDYLFRILPALRAGVMVHVHDIFYPFEYPPAWIQREKRSWNEAYALRAFLQYNDAFEVVLFNNYLGRKHARLIREKAPRCAGNEGGSLWLRKIR